MVLDEHRKNCEREGKLDEAHQARKRLKELRILEEQKRRVETDSKHVSLFGDCSNKKCWLSSRRINRS